MAEEARKGSADSVITALENDIKAGVVQRDEIIKLFRGLRKLSKEWNCRIVIEGTKGSDLSGTSLWITEKGISLLREHHSLNQSLSDAEVKYRLLFMVLEKKLKIEFVFNL